MEYSNRKEKASFVYDKYHGILKGKILDVGADAQYLKPYVLQGGAEYTGIGFGDQVDLEIDLDKSSLPYDDKSFDTVLCFDVLEHLEKIHFIFSELCRVSKSHVIISLPNPYASFYSMLRNGGVLKFYDLPVEPPEDRHRWFYSEKSAKNFIAYNAHKHGFEVNEMFAIGDDKALGGSGVKGLLGRQLLKNIFRKDIIDLSLHHSTLWSVLERK